MGCVCGGMMGSRGPLGICNTREYLKKDVFVKCS